MVVQVVFKLLSISVPFLTEFVEVSGQFNFSGGFNFSGITLPDPEGFNPYPDPPIRNDPKTPAEIEALLKEYKIIPDVLNESPKYPIRVHYKSPFKNTTVEFGTILKMLEVEVDPVRVSWPYSPGSYYTLILTDPDSPNPAKPWDREFHHWLVGNIYENNWKHGDVLTEYIGTIPPEKAGMHRFIFIVFEQPKGKIKFNEPSVYDIAKCVTGAEITRAMKHVVHITTARSLHMIEVTSSVQQPSGKANKFQLVFVEWSSTHECYGPPLRKRSKFSTVDFAKKYHLGPPYAVNFFQVKFEDWIPTIRNWTTPFFRALSSEWTTVFQRSPKPKPTPRMRPKRIWTRPPGFTAVTQH